QGDGLHRGERPGARRGRGEWRTRGDRGRSERAFLYRPAKEMTRILIVRLGAMGDVVHALPAVAALRAELPSTHIGWAIEERWAELLCGSETCEARGPAMPLVDALHFVNTRAWRAAPLSDETWRE